MRARAILLSVLFALPLAATAADKDIEDLLAKMRKVYSGASSVHITTSTLLPTEVGEMDLTIDTQYMKSNMIWSRVTGLPQAGKEGLIWKSDGKSIQSTTPQGPKVEPFSVRKAETGLPVNLEVISFWDWKRQLSTAAGANMNKSKFRLVKKETWKDQDYLVLEETASEQKVFVRYFIDPKTFLIKRTRVENLDTHDLVMDCKVSKLDMNAKIDTKIFKIETKGIKL